MLVVADGGGHGRRGGDADAERFEALARRADDLQLVVDGRYEETDALFAADMLDHGEVVGVVGERYAKRPIRHEHRRRERIDVRDDPPAVGASARLKAFTSGTRLDAAVTSTLSGITASLPIRPPPSPGRRRRMLAPQSCGRDARPRVTAGCAPRPVAGRSATRSPGWTMSPASSVRGCVEAAATR